MDCVYRGRPIIEGGQTSTGSIIAWFKRHFAEHIAFDSLNAQAAALPPPCRRGPRGCWYRTIFRATAPPTPTRCHAARSWA